MFDQLVGLLLVGLGLKNPMSGQVAGEQTSQLQTVNEDVRLGPTSGTFERRGELKNKLEQARETYRGNTQAQKDEFKKKLGEFKDKKKQSLTARVNAKLGDVNTKRTAKMNGYLTKLEGVLEKLTTRSSDLKAKGKNTSSADAKLATVRTTIDAAKAAVNAQAGKSYTLTITSEATVKADVGSATKGLQTDLQTTYSLVKAAKSAVKDAALALKALSDEPGTKSTVSPTAAP